MRTGAQGIVFRDRRAFWAGVSAVTAGVAMHLPMYLGAGDMDYRLEGMPVDSTMKAGMALIVTGIALTAYGIVPPRGRRDPGGARARAVVEPDPHEREEHVEGRYAQLFRRPFGGLTIGVALFGIGWGLVNKPQEAVNVP